MDIKPTLRRNDLLYPELSYEINGALIDVYKQLGGGHEERHFQKATAESLRLKKIAFEEQCYTYRLNLMTK